ncbi:hypothetical protein ACWCZ5_03160 [Streptomyces sp. NPDC001667]
MLVTTRRPDGLPRFGRAVLTIAQKSRRENSGGIALTVVAKHRTVPEAGRSMNVKHTTHRQLDCGSCVCIDLRRCHITTRFARVRSPIVQSIIEQMIRLILEHS